jgi:hypothetical protein
MVKIELGHFLPSSQMGYPFFQICDVLCHYGIGRVQLYSRDKTKQST